MVKGQKETRSEFGKRLRKVRQGITQPQLAEALGVSATAISTVERGRQQPSNWLLSRLVAFFGLKVTGLPIEPEYPKHICRHKEWVFVPDMNAALCKGCHGLRKFTLRDEPKWLKHM